MALFSDLRVFERIPIEKRVQVQVRGRMASYAIAMNISMGGLFLSAAPPLAVGTPCELAIPSSGSVGGKNVLAEGTVIRNDDMGTAIRFAKALDENLLKKFVYDNRVVTGNSFLNSYINYFKVSQSENSADCEKLIGIDKRTFNNVFLTTFCICIPLAILPVFAFQSSIPTSPAWVKIAASFGYGLIWIGIIQPSIDLIVFRFIKHKATA